MLLSACEAREGSPGYPHRLSCTKAAVLRSDEEVSFESEFMTKRSIYLDLARNAKEL